ncbi:MAG: alkaline phosphatase [Bacteroidales bacterium]|nr:alkaline phosphatase [Bacteroidales bacterium]
MKKYLFTALAATWLSLCAQAQAQPQVYIHSHNDYAQSAPFWLAYSQNARSVECDMFHIRGTKFLIGHERSDFSYNQDFDTYYMNPIIQVFGYNGGHPWGDDENREIQLMIDIKSENYDVFLKALGKKLGKYPEVFDRSVNPHACRVVITGNGPMPYEYEKYAKFICFDGGVDRDYTPAQLERLVILNAYFGNYSDWNGRGEMPSEQAAAIRGIIEKAHSMGKPIRIWGTPETANTWLTLIGLGVDYINTDHPDWVANFLRNLKPGAAERVEAYIPSHLNDGAEDKPVKNVIHINARGMGLAQMTAADSTNSGLSMMNMRYMGLLEKGVSLGDCFRATGKVCGTADSEDLAGATRSSIEKLSKEGGNGFFLQVESGKIKLNGYPQSIPDSFKGVLDYDKAVAEALRFADSNGETLVIVTADDYTTAYPLILAYGPGASKFSGRCSQGGITGIIKEICK